MAVPQPRPAERRGPLTSASPVPTVMVEWAQRGKTASDRGDRLLGWSDGTLGRRNFEEALTRYSPGTLDNLPQVTVGFLPGDGPEQHYIAIAVHDWATGELRDADRRRIAVTNCFCAPYAELARAAVSYQDMLAACQRTDLPVPGRKPARVGLAAPLWRPAADDELARQVAALLLTGRPVCVLDANAESAQRRLGFIDAVMSLLPYGMRSRMSAATWTSSTYRGHKFRLFFSDAPRTTEEPDQLVFWGQPARTPLRDAPDCVRDYLRWLEYQIRQPVPDLAAQTDKAGFTAAEVLRLLVRNGVASRSRQDVAPDEHETELPGPVPPAPRRPAPGIADLVSGCADRIASADLAGLRSGIAAIEKCLSRNGSPSPELRARCRAVIAARGLLDQQPGPHQQLAAPLHSVLLRLAFEVPLSYAGYCQLEDCLRDGATPHRALLAEISRLGLADVRARAIVRWQLGSPELSQWYRCADFDVRQLLRELAGDWPREQHARIVCDVVLRYIRQRRGHRAPDGIAAALHACGYLAPALQQHHPRDTQFQADVLTELLRAAYPHGLGRPAVSRVLAGSGQQPTFALLTAVLGRLEDAADAELAWQEYRRGAIACSGLDDDTRRRVQALLTEPW